MGWLWRWLTRPTRPEQFSPYVIANFDALNELQIGELERTLARNFPRHPEGDLLYALRISAVIRRVTKLKTLASRWNVAHCGAGSRGLLAAERRAKNYRLVHTFLAGLYLKRFREIAETMKRAAAEKKTSAAIAKTLKKAEDKIWDALCDIAFPLPGIEEFVPKS